MGEEGASPPLPRIQIRLPLITAVRLSQTHSPLLFWRVWASLSPGFALLVPRSAREGKCNGACLALSTTMPGLSGRACPGLPSKLVLARLPTLGGEARPWSHPHAPAQPSPSAVLPFSGQPKVSDAGIKYQPKKANIRPPSSSSGYIKHDKRLRAEGLAQQRDQGWLQQPQGQGIRAVLDADGQPCVVG